MGDDGTSLRQSTSCGVMVTALLGGFVSVKCYDRFLCLFLGLRWVMFVGEHHRVLRRLLAQDRFVSMFVLPGGSCLPLSLCPTLPPG